MNGFAALQEPLPAKTPVKAQPQAPAAPKAAARGLGAALRPAISKRENSYASGCPVHIEFFVFRSPDVVCICAVPLYVSPLYDSPPYASFFFCRAAA